MMLVLLEPIVAVPLAALAMGETLTFTRAMGGVLILAAVVLQIRFR